MSPSRLASPVWRLSHLYSFKPKEGGRKTFRPNRFQAERFNRLYPKFFARQGHKEIELKSRKFRTTTGCCFFCLGCAAYRKNTEAVTMAHKSEKATEIFNSIVRPAWGDIPEQLRPRDRFNNRTEIDLMDSIRSKYIVLGDLKATTPDILHMTEVAYFPDDEKIREALAALPPQRHLHRGVHGLRRGHLVQTDLHGRLGGAEGRDVARVAPGFQRRFPWGLTQ